PSRTSTFETLTIAELGGPETVSPVPKKCDESGWLRGSWTFDTQPLIAHLISRRDAARRVSLTAPTKTGQAPSLDKDPIQHQVDDHARQRYVEPERKRPAGDGLMPVKLLTQRAGQRHDHHRRNDQSQRGVRNQNGEVERPRPSRAAKMHGTHVIVVVEIRHEKKGRGGQ